MSKGAFQSAERDKALEVRQGEEGRGSRQGAKGGGGEAGLTRHPGPHHHRLNRPAPTPVVLPILGPVPQALLDRAVTPALPSEEVTRLSLSKIKRAYSILKKGAGGAGMAAVVEED